VLTDGLVIVASSLGDALQVLLLREVLIFLYQLRCPERHWLDCECHLLTLFYFLFFLLFKLLSTNSFLFFALLLQKSLLTLLLVIISSLRTLSHQVGVPIIGSIDCAAKIESFLRNVIRCLLDIWNTPKITSQH
jgi:hypothetical protein